MTEQIVETFSAWEFRSILDSINDAIFIDDKDGNTLWCNKACFDLYKITPDEVIGTHVRELEKKGIFSPSVAGIVLEKKRETTIIHENKEGRKLLSTGIPILDREGKITKVITTSRDITELSLLQNKLEASKSMEDDATLEKYFEKGVVASSPAMYNVFQLAKRLSTVDSTVLITGESGVGKGVIAHYLHENGDRRHAPFITVNCGAIPENLMESELFGYEKGAFTGARSDGKQGVFEAAQNGTIFLDEISELPLNLQVKLLQVIQDRYIVKVGSTEKIPVDVRIISATNKDLHALVQEQEFREDLYYRLNVVPIIVPPLRERKDDILPLIQQFIHKYNHRYQQNKRLDKDALDILLQFDWPGNIRELQNIVERLILTTNSDLISIKHLPLFLLKNSPSHLGQGGRHQTLATAVEAAETAVLKAALNKYKTTRAMADALEVSQPTIVRKLHKYGLSPGSETSDTE